MFAGESWTIQQFVSLACLLHAAGPTSWRSNLEWREPSSLHKRCHGEARCHYEKGNALFVFGDTTIQLRTCGIMGLESRLYRRCLAPARLQPKDVLVYGSIGSHYTGEGDLHQSSWNVTRLASLEPGLLLRAVSFVDDSHGFKPSAGSPLVIWREVLPQHFPSPGGHYWHGLDPPGMHYNTKKDVAGQCDETHNLTEMWTYHRWNKVTLPIVERATGVRTLRVWQSATYAGDAHLTYGDCTHWCMPGVPEHWTEQLLNMLLAGPSQQQARATQATPAEVGERDVADHATISTGSSAATVIPTLPKIFEHDSDTGENGR